MRIKRSNPFPLSSSNASDTITAGKAKARETVSAASHDAVMTTDILKKNIFKKDRSSDTVNVPELLSPAGDPECARAAIICGADAIYLGLKEGSARAGAGNFTFEELGETCRLARSMGVKVPRSARTSFSLAS